MSNFATQKPFMFSFDIPGTELCVSNTNNSNQVKLPASKPARLCRQAAKQVLQ
jgi:hypothetical protein